MRRDLRQNPGAVAGAGIRAHAASVGQVDETTERALDDVTRGTPLDVDHQPDSTGVTLERWIVEGSDSTLLAVKDACHQASFCLSMSANHPTQRR